MISGRVEIRKLNSLRGLAALIVLVSHYSNEAGLWGKALGNGAGQFGVMIFFLLSAFLISYLYLDTPPTRESVTSFAIARVARVVPLFLVTVIVSFSVKCYLPDPFGAFAYNIPDVDTLLFHLLFLKGVGVLWTIPPEIHFYMFFAMAWALRPHLQGALHVLIIILLCIPFFVEKGEPAFTTTVTASPAIVQVFSYFGVGFLLGHLFRHWQPHPRLRSHYYSFSLIIIPLLYPDVFSYFTGQQHGMWTDARIMAIVTAVFFMLVFLVPEKNWVLENRAGDLLGRVSYSLYLLHYPLLLLLKRLGFATGIGGLALFLSVALAVAYVSFSAIELPMRRRIRAAFIHNNWS